MTSFFPGLPRGRTVRAVFRKPAAGRPPRRRRQRLDVEHLERRDLLAADLVGPDITAYPVQLQPLQQPPVIASRNGVLEANVRLVSAGTDSNPIRYGTEDLYSGSTTDDATDQQIAAMAYQFEAYGTSYPAAFPGATLQLDPGDTLRLTITNDLSINLDGNEIATNFHFHGGHVPAMGQGDNVYRSLGPGETMEVVIPVPPAAQSAGMNWYHPHHHMSTHVQVYGGLAGTIQIGDTLDAWPQYTGVFDELTLALSEVNIQNGALNALGTNSGFMTGWQKRINGQLNPTMTMRPGETQIWNVANIGSRGLFNLAITDENLGNPWQATILAFDGNETNMRPLPLALSADPLRMQNALAPTAIPGGGRMAMAVTAPTEPGTYYVVDGWGGDEFAGRPLPGRETYYKLATIQVTGEPVTEPVPVFPGQAPDPLFDTTADVTREVVFNYIGDTPEKQLENLLKDIFGINGEQFGANITPLVEIGTVEEWTIRNETIISHSFHIHQGKFIVTAVNDVPVDPLAPLGAGEQTYVSPLDVVMVPPLESVTIRFEVENFPGNYVFHCHILPHEDQGMMATVRAVGPTAGEQIPVSNVAASTTGAVRLIDGQTRSLAVRRPFGTYRGPVVSAAGFDLGQTVQTVAMGTGRRNAEIKIFENGASEAAATFTAFTRAESNGVSVGIGPISVDGRLVVAAGSRGRGTPRVRLFDTAGNLLRELVNVLPAGRHNGVNVTVGDVDGDNFADLIVSGRAGGVPVVTAFCGEDLATGVADPERLFTFTAAGGPRAGARVAVGHLSPSTIPTYMPNIVTTPETGRRAGLVQVWNAGDFVPYMAHDDGAHGGGMHDGGMTHMGGTMPAEAAMPGEAAMPPTPVATFRPFGRSRRAVDLAAMHLRSDGQQPVLPVVASWQTSRRVAFSALSDTNQVSTRFRNYARSRGQEQAALTIATWAAWLQSAQAGASHQAATAASHSGHGIHSTGPPP